MIKSDVASVLDPSIDRRSLTFVQDLSNGLKTFNAVTHRLNGHHNRLSNDQSYQSPYPAPEQQGHKHGGAVDARWQPARIFQPCFKEKPASQSAFVWQAFSARPFFRLKAYSPAERHIYLLRVVACRSPQLKPVHSRHRDGKTSRNRCNLLC